MARKKAFADTVQQECEKEAKDFVLDWYQRQDIAIKPAELFIVWFAFTDHGYRCMISSYVNQNSFFELKVNKRTHAIQCDCYHRYEHVVINGLCQKEVSLI